MSQCHAPKCSVMRICVSHILGVDPRHDHSVVHSLMVWLPDRMASCCGSCFASAWSTICQNLSGGPPGELGCSTQRYSPSAALCRYAKAALLMTISQERRAHAKTAREHHTAPAGRVRFASVLPVLLEAVSGSLLFYVHALMISDVLCTNRAF